MNVTVVADGQRLEEALRWPPEFAMRESPPPLAVAVWDEAIWITVAPCVPYSLKIYPVADHRIEERRSVLRQ